MLAANAEMDVRTRCPAPLHRHVNKLAHTIHVQRDEGIGRKDSLGRVFTDEAGAVVAADAECRLGTRSSSARETTSGTMISGMGGFPVVFATSATASNTARACMSTISG